MLRKDIKGGYLSLRSNCIYFVFRLLRQAFPCSTVADIESISRGSTDLRPVSVYNSLPPAVRLTDRFPCWTLKIHIIYLISLQTVSSNSRSTFSIVLHVELRFFSISHSKSAAKLVPSTWVNIMPASSMRVVEKSSAMRQYSYKPRIMNNTMPCYDRTPVGSKLMTAGKRGACWLAASAAHALTFRASFSARCGA